jgi:ATP-dependent Clp protease ATP-binding subunit ClpC
MTDYTGGGDQSRGSLEQVIEDARKLESELGDEPTRGDLEASRLFAAAVARLERQSCQLDVLAKLTRDRNLWVSRIALGALAERPDRPPSWIAQVVRRLQDAPYDQCWLYLRTLQHVPDPVIGAVLSQIDELLHGDAAELIAARIDGGRELVDLATFEKVPVEHAELIESMLDEYEDIIPSVRAVFEEWRSSTIDLEFLGRFARVWTRPYASPPALLVGGRRELVEVIHEAVSAMPPQSLLLVGEHGVGKTALTRAALERLPPHWLVFDATASNLHAGSVYVGELETRVAELVQRLKGRNAVWVVPSFVETLYAGRHNQSPTGLFDFLLPHIQAGDLRIIGEVTPEDAEAILAQRPQAGSAFRAVRIRPLKDEEAVAVAADALEHESPGIEAPEQVLVESFELAQQFLPGSAPPGNLLRLLQPTAEAVSERGDTELYTADVLATLARVSGLPLTLLDPSAPLDLEQVRKFFEARVLGQKEAVDALVERVALIKAGLTDPTRPLGVFLFVGPTGTGKTEIAKALAEYVFGAASRLTRLDMSEYQTPDSLERLITDTSMEWRGAPLVAAVRKDPFSVILLDEFEKAAAPIWDLFLQVFDDGRLTDLHGRLVDFRRCVIIMTANVGSAIASGHAVGFGSTPEPFRPQTIERAVKRSFRPEFLNRIDRVVVFRPFERTQMRALLEKELADVERRRGLRRRPWAAEYDESALSFLIEQGFSPELGARPLKRAVERYLLVPLAEAIVDQRVPEGDQFLFVTAAKGKIDVQFIDPDADEAAGPREPEDVARDLDLRSLTLAPRSDPAAAAYLLDELLQIEADADAVVRRGKEAALQALSQPDFWERADRFEILGEAEYLDRFEAALRTATKLAGRVQQHNGSGSVELVGVLASRLYVLDSALAGLAHGAPFELFLRIRPAGDASEETAAFAASLAAMYLSWGERRGMRLEELEDRPGTHVLAVSGLGASTILAPESGLHLLEQPGEGEGARAHRVAVAVELVPAVAARDDQRATLRDRAEAAFADAALPAQVVRRYRGGSSPLVRDAVRNYRTGRLDRVLEGDFDVF